jgi:hypothetical protein
MVSDEVMVMPEREQLIIINAPWYNLSIASFVE